MGRRPICQDTGAANIHVKYGMQAKTDFSRSLQEICDEGTRLGYQRDTNPLRASVVVDPFGERKNSGDNTPCMLTVEMVEGDKIEVEVAAKGGGSENKSKFTTLNPSVGIVEYGDGDYRTVLLADIPGLIEGASDNRGLGHRFLRHIERCKKLILILDMGGVDERDPVDDYQQLLSELERYDPAFLERPRLLAANKMDLPKASDNLKRLRKITKDEILPLSCETGEGLEELKEQL